MDGKELGQILPEACRRSGLDERQTALVCANVTLIWGERIMAEMDRLQFNAIVQGFDE